MALYDGEERAGAGAVQPSNTGLGHHRRIASVWSLKRVAVAATRGLLFGAPSPPSTDDDVSQDVDECRHRSDCAPSTFKMVHKSSSSPSLDPSTQHRGRPSYPRDEATRRPTFPFASPASPRPRTLTSVGRPVISSPSLPLHLNGAATLNSKLSYPIMMSPSLPSSTTSPIIPPATPRRRTKSAPGPKLSNKPVPVALSDYPASPNEFGIIDLPPPISYSSSVPLPDHYPTTLTSPIHSSPRSISSVKRKPVPRHSIRLESSQEALGGPMSTPSFLFQRHRVDSEVPPRTTSPASYTPDDDALLLNSLKCPQTPSSDCGMSSSQKIIQALSPLTVEEMDAIQCFARENEGMHYDTRRRRHRRRDLRPRRLRRESYHMHTAIVDSYFDGSDEEILQQCPQPSSYFSASDASSILDGRPISRSSSSSSSSSYPGGAIQSGDSEQLEGGVLPLRVNRGTFGVYDTPVQSPSAKKSYSGDWDANEAADTSVLEDVVNDVNDTMEIFRPSSVSQSHSASCESPLLDLGDDALVPDLERVERRGGLHARDENPVSNLVRSTKPVFALAAFRSTSPSPELREYRVEGAERAGATFRRDEDTNTSFSSYSTPDIGVAIMSKEDIARFESEVENENEYNRDEEMHLVSAFSCSSESDHGGSVDDEDDCDEDEDNKPSSSLTYEPLVSPLTLEEISMPMRTTPPPDFELADLSMSYDRLQTSLSKLRATHSPSRDANASYLGSSTSSSLFSNSTSTSTKLSLKPALRINSSFSGFHSISTAASSPSPPTPCSLLPPLSPAFVLPSSDCETSSRESMSPRSPTFSTFPSTTRALQGKGVGGGYQYQYGTPPVPSFIHLTPNEPPEKKQLRLGRGRLRKLFSRSGAKK